MDIHCVIISTLSASETTTILWNAGIHVHVVDDTLQKFVLPPIHVYVCTLSPLTERFLPVLHYHNYYAAILYSAGSAISILRAQMCVRMLRDRPTPPCISLITRKPADTMLTNFRSVRAWLNRIRARSF